MPQPKKKKSVPARKSSKSSPRAPSRASSNRASSKKAPVVELALAEESSVALAEAPQDEPESPVAVIEEIPIASSTSEEGSPELRDSDLRAEEPAGEAVAEVLSPDAGAALG
ncbi:hypothetical protein HYR69_01785, partial [Candidatus Sumerlaeota bacterium]|nr:hypothetical protein [Candidatus Sumerlaeota bacterium]